MTARNKKDSNAEPLDIGPLVEDFHAIEVLHEHLAMVGWAVEYRQLEAGQLEARLACREADGIVLAQTAVSHRVVGSSRSPDDMFTIAMSDSRNTLLLNGRSINQDGFIVIPPKTDVHVSSIGGGWNVVSMLMPVDRFAEHMETVHDNHSLLETNEITLFEQPKAVIEPLRRMVSAALLPRPGRQAHAVEESDFAAESSKLLGSSGLEKSTGDPYRRLKKHRIVVRAKEYIHEHLTEAIHVTDLCKYCGVSLSTLERIFTRELGLTPNGYIQAARLHEARHALQNTNGEDVTIADIAMNSGFTHMGRFSRRYHAHFGRLPSEERSLVNGKT